MTDTTAIAITHLIAMLLGVVLGIYLDRFEK
jgi:ABC-type phosphate transport system permease subunit